MNYRYVIGSLTVLLMSGCGQFEAKITDLSPKNCTVERISATESLVTCPDGTQSTIKDGSNGADGKDGSNGADGANGKDGADGTEVRMVQLCASQSEYAMCVGGKLYAPSWNDHTMFTELTAGTYTSSSTHLKCSFVVAASCSVTQVATHSDSEDKDSEDKDSEDKD